MHARHALRRGLGRERVVDGVVGREEGEDVEEREQERVVERRDHGRTRPD